MRIYSALGLAACLACLALQSGIAEPPAGDSPKAAPTVASISGPFSHANLSIFLLHGPDILDGRRFITLNEALEQKAIVVHETSNVNLLAVENTSDRYDIFLQSGDIIKGGRQDRLISIDLIVPPKSGRIPITSFCVESGRWHQRGQESAAHFSMNTAQAGRDIKLAANSGGLGMAGGMGGGRAGVGGQSEVWSKVADAQRKLGRSLDKTVTSKDSPTSYQLTLEDKAVLEKLAAFEKVLAGVLKDQPDVIGIAYAVNGRVEGAEVFGCSSLCSKQWNKLLKSCAVDALAESNDKKNFEPTTAAKVEAFLKDSTGPLKELPIVSEDPSGPTQQVRNAVQDQQAARPQPGKAATQPPSVRIFQCDKKDSLLIESRERQSDIVLHRSYLRKDAPAPADKATPSQQRDR